MHSLRHWHRDKTAVVPDSGSPESRQAGTTRPVLRPHCDPGMDGEVEGVMTASLGAPKERSPKAGRKAAVVKWGRAGREEEPVWGVPALSN